MSHLFESLCLRNVTLPNRIGIPPMCQYSARDSWPRQYLRAAPADSSGR